MGNSDTFFSAAEGQNAEQGVFHAGRAYAEVTHDYLCLMEKSRSEGDVATWLSAANIVYDRLRPYIDNKPPKKDKYAQSERQRLDNTRKYLGKQENHYRQMRQNQQKGILTNLPAPNAELAQQMEEFHQELIIKGHEADIWGPKKNKEDLDSV